MSSFQETYNLTKVGYAYENIDTFFNKETQEETKKQAKKFLELLLINNGEMSFEYVYAKYTNYGRKYSWGIQGISKNIRNFLLADSGIVDYDIKNAHPTILYYLCVKHKIHTENQILKSYVFNRDSVIQDNFQQEVYEGKDVKKLILTATNCDDMLFTKNKWLIQYQEEMIFIREELKKNKDYKKILQDTQKIKQDKNNLNSSFVNRILCKVESEIIDKFVSFIRNQDYQIFALMFDGLMVNGGSDDLLDQLNQVIKYTYGDYFQITQKPIETDINDSDYVFDKDKLLGKIDSLETRMNLFVNKFNPIKIINPALYGIQQLDGTYEFYKKDAFIQSVEHIRYTDKKGISCAVVIKWLTEYITEEVIFNEIITDPTYDKKDNYNIWTNWDIENWDDEWFEDLNAIEFMKQHILVLCNYDKEVAKTMELWISHAFKYPKNKSFVPIFIGKQGAGKDMFFAWIEKMMGEKKKFETSTPEKNIWGNFNPFMKSAYLIHLSEFGRKNTQDYVGQIKAITTTGKITINEKNKGEYQIDSFHRFIGASNYAEPIPIESDNRRYLIIHTSPDKIGNTEYFNQGWGYLKDKNAIKSMYDYFMSLDPPENFQYHMIKETEYMEYLKDISRPQEECWLHHFVNNNKKDSKIDRFRTLDLYDNYKGWCQQTRQSYTMEKRKFLIQVKVAVGNTTKHIQIKKTNGVICAVFDWDCIEEEGVYTEDELVDFDTIDNIED
tara:strand:+ start:440 stop:2614 length:2175 start_codon:yes stop_codon:yes gene_type:complete